MKIEIEVPDEQIRATVQGVADSALKSYMSGGSGGPVWHLLKERTEQAVLAAVRAMDFDAMVAEAVARIAGSTIDAAVTAAIERRAKAAIKKASEAERAKAENAATGTLFPCP